MMKTVSYRFRVIMLGAKGAQIYAKCRGNATAWWRILHNAAYTGNSSKAWYLLADPNDLPVIEVAFLNGQESPTIETADADFNVLGVQMRGYHDFGVALQDPRGGVKAKGEA